MHPVFSACLLGHYQVTYYYCPTSGLLQTEPPYWLEEAYQTSITELDIGLVSRNLRNQKRLEPYLFRLFKPNDTCLDLGGGYGLLTRLLRDIGFNAFTYDRYCKNLFASGFEPGVDFKANVLFAFEVLEHIPDPYDFLAAAFERHHCRTLFFSTVTFERAIPGLDWWYYAFETGQHITFYQPCTLMQLAAKLGCRYYWLGSDFHLMTPQPLSRYDRLCLLHPYFAPVYAAYCRYRRRALSHLWGDYLLARQRLQVKP